MRVFKHARLGMNSSIPCFLGTYTSKLGHVDGCGPGVVPCEIDSRGRIAQTGPALAIPNPSYLWLNRFGDRLYSICEICAFEGKEDGAICVISTENRSKLKLLQQASSQGKGPAYCRGNLSESLLLTANYVEGNVVAFPIQKDGTLSSATSSVQHEGTGPNAARQEGPHPHSIMALPHGDDVYAADLGIDTLVAYRLDEKAGLLEPLKSKDIKLPSGSGPRHFVLHPKLRYAYVALELAREIARVSLHRDTENLTYPSFSTNGEEVAHLSEILITKCGSHLYIANRGVDLISAFEIADSGELKWLVDYPCGGVTPRHIALTPDETMLVVANQDSSNVSTFFRNSANGSLEPTGHDFEIGTPCFIEFAR